MNRIIVALLLSSVLISCGPKPQPAEETRSQVTISDIAVETNNHEMTVSWKRQGSGTISGYNIYIAEKPNAAGNSSGIKPFNPTSFPGDTDPDDGIEHFVATGLENGTKYYVSVRVLFPDGSMSASTDELMAVCGPKGEIELAVRYKGDHDGFSFEKNQYVKANSVDNDLYFFSQDGVDYLASPSRLDGFINHSKFLEIEFIDNYEKLTAHLMTAQLTPTEERVPVKERHWVLVKTQRGTYALLWVLSFSGEGENRQIKLRYAYHVPVGDSHL